MSLLNKSVPRFACLLPLISFPLKWLPHELIVLLPELPNALFLLGRLLLIFLVLVKFFLFSLKSLLKGNLFFVGGPSFIGFRLFGGIFIEVLIFGGVLNGNTLRLGRWFFVLLKGCGVSMDVLPGLRGDRNVLQVSWLFLLVEVLLLRWVRVMWWVFAEILHSVKVACSFGVLTSTVHWDFDILKHARLLLKFNGLINFVNIERVTVLINLFVRTLTSVNLNGLILSI